MYGHVNNAVYYQWFDTLVNRFLIEKTGLEPTTSAQIGLVVETGCSYFAPLAFPEQIEAGLVVTKIGNSSVRYQIGIFAQNAQAPAAQGHFVHVYVDRNSRRPKPMRPAIRAVLQAFAAQA
ncbi:MAG TPA: acyl-CoA thioesterase [Hellea balneolensis]|uniref:Acyl-CoA thioesterase n=1 Tax=Hellea balneolensis TaxID=287478 RepID=A0A7V5NX45_9PROT|nr:acyl-CoA thioesterase [Hellea balneolensis]